MGISWTMLGSGLAVYVDGMIEGNAIAGEPDAHSLASL